MCVYKHQILKCETERAKTFKSNYENVKSDCINVQKSKNNFKFHFPIVISIYPNIKYTKVEFKMQALKLI